MGKIKREGKSTGGEKEGRRERERGTCRPQKWEGNGCSGTFVDRIMYCKVRKKLPQGFLPSQWAKTE